MAFNASSYDPYYRATLTYIYNNPEQQMGDYSRDFGKREDAESWANSYKGEAIKIHVDPRDPTRSVLREEDLKTDGCTLEPVIGIRVAPACTLARRDSQADIRLNREH